MISIVRDWLDARKRAEVQQRYASGFDYGAGSLLQGVQPQHLEDQIFTLSAFDDGHDAFDAGVTAAIREWGKVLRARENTCRAKTSQ